MSAIEIIIKIELPLKRIPLMKCNRAMPWHVRWFGWLYLWGGVSVQEFGGKRMNITRHLQIFRWHVLTIHWNEYHDKSDKERADEYLRKWAESDKELRGLRLLLLGDATNAEAKKIIRDSLGVDLDEGIIL